MTIVSPADSTEVVKATEALLNFEGPVYLRLCGETNDPMVYKSDYDFEIGKAITLCEGVDVTIVSTGTMVYQSLQAAKKLAEQGIECTVINMHTIKPLDTNVLAKYCHDCKLVVTCEEGFVSGGLGAAVAETLVQSGKKIPPVSYTHLDVYKRQVLILSCRLTIISFKRVRSPNSNFLKLLKRRKRCTIY